MNISSQDVCNDLTSLLKQFKAQMAELADEFGMTSIQLYALNVIADNYATMGKVAQVLHCDASNVTGIVDRLTALGLIVRIENPQDRRVKTLQLTSKGQEIMNHVLSQLPNRLGCNKLDSEERTTLHTIIGKLQQAQV